MRLIALLAVGALGTCGGMNEPPLQAPPPPTAEPAPAPPAPAPPPAAATPGAAVPSMGDGGASRADGGAKADAAAQGGDRKG